MYDMIRCENCNKYIHTDMDVCPFCGHSSKPIVVKKKHTAARMALLAVALGIFIFGIVSSGLFQNGFTAKSKSSDTAISDDFSDRQILNWSAYNARTLKPISGLLKSSDGKISLPAADDNIYTVVSKPLTVADNGKIVLNRTVLLKDAKNYTGMLVLLGSNTKDLSVARPVYSFFYRTGKTMADQVSEGYYICEYNDNTMIVAKNTRLEPILNNSYTEQIQIDTGSGQIEWKIGKYGYKGQGKIFGYSYLYVMMATETKKEEGNFSLDTFNLSITAPVAPASSNPSASPAASAHSSASM